jgi:quinate dehydrogenase
MAASLLANSRQMVEESITSPEHLDGVAYLYGHPLLNSLSPPLHQTIYNNLGLNWAQVSLSVSDISSLTYPPPYTLSPPIEKFLASTRSNPKFVGSSVTMPWKVSIMPHLDDLTEEARQIGACNTIYLRKENGRRVFVGTNTDCVGIRESLLQNSLTGSLDNDSYRNKPAMIIGGGGTARAAIYTLRRWLGCSKIYIVNRDRSEVETILAEDASRSYNGSKSEIIYISELDGIDELESPAAIVSGIPNYPPKTAEEIKTRKIIQAMLGSPLPGGKLKGVLLEMCYHPLPWTDISELAKQAGWKVIGGSEALIWQGLEQAKLWTGRDIIAQPGLVEQVKDVVAKEMERRARQSAKL